jgi:hypothetical protein
MGTRIISLGYEADHSPPSSIEVKMHGALPPFSICINGIVCNGVIVNYRDSFTFTVREKYAI